MMSTDPFEVAVNRYYDERIGTLGKILTRSLDADTLTLTALNVLTYAQLEGGVKDLAAIVVKHVNQRKLEIGQINPCLLKWRSEDELGLFRSKVSFESIASQYPFEALLKQPIRIKAIDRRYELNQMSWAALKSVYIGLGLDPSQIQLHSAQMDELVKARNQTAHHGITPSIESVLMEKQLRSNVQMVENVLTDLSLQLLSFFSGKLHLRKVAGA